jgi:hypothetical protein
MNESSGLEIQYRWNGSETRVVSYSRTRLVILASCASGVILGLGIQIGRMSLNPPDHEQAELVQGSQKPSSTESELQQAPNVTLTPIKESPSTAAQAAQTRQSQTAAQPLNTPHSIESTKSNQSSKANTAVRESEGRISIKSVQTKSSGNSIEFQLTIVNLYGEMLSGSITISTGEAASNPVRFSMRNSVTKTLVLNSINIAENESTEIPVVVTIRDQDDKITKKETLLIKVNAKGESNPNKKSQFASRSNE